MDKDKRKYNTYKEIYAKLINPDYPIRMYYEIDFITPITIESCLKYIKEYELKHSIFKTIADKYKL